jgi:hypothetical protein
MPARPHHRQWISPGKNTDLYWREDILIQQISISAPDLFGLRPTDVANYLRVHDMTVTAWTDGITVDRPFSALAIPQRRTAIIYRFTQKNEIGWG